MFIPSIGGKSVSGDGGLSGCALGRPLRKPGVAGSGGIDVKGMQPSFELGLQHVVHGPMFRQARQACEGCRPDFHRIMSLAARSCACVTVVEMRLVNYIELGRRKCCNQRCSHALYAGCQFLRH